MLFGAVSASFLERVYLHYRFWVSGLGGIANRYHSMISALYLDIGVCTKVLWNLYVYSVPPKTEEHLHLFHLVEYA